MTPPQGVTIYYLKICDLSELRPRVCDDPLFRIDECVVKQPALNRFLYACIGGPWAWKERSAFTDQQWNECIRDPNLKTFLALYAGSIAGYYEMVRDNEGDVEIRYFGLAPEFIGRGFGGPLLTHAIRTGFAWPAKCVWLHTCTLDHPNALAHYQARGMRLYKTETK